MYLSARAVLAAINTLRATVHPFIGITFVACKHYGLSIGSADRVSLDSLTRTHMDVHHRIDRRSSHYFQPFRGSSAWWVADRYPSSGLQTVNTQTFRPVFLHPRAKPEWGFTDGYLDQIEVILQQQGYPTRVPADALAVWLFKDEDIGNIFSYEDLSSLFFDKYKITPQERKCLFSGNLLADRLRTNDAFVTDPLEMTAVLRDLPEPPDAASEGGRTITSIRLIDAGPSREMQLEFGPRLSIITGDNGLGKSFLLDFTWWAATGHWAEREALPQQDETNVNPRVEYSLSTASGRLSTYTAKFDWKNYAWLHDRKSMTVEALAVFSRADGSFAISDPIRGQFNRSSPNSGSLSAIDIWNGKAGEIEGLIRDWIRWQTADDRKVFDQFTSILKRLSPDDLGILSPGPAIRVPGDPRDIPTITHLYGTVPITHASAGVQRVLLLAYLVIWSWQEHELAAARLKQSPLRRMMVIVDEIEAHLHPKWQRIVLPAVLGIGDLLSSDLAIQMVAATHSPMILASMETSFDPDTDVLYHLYGDGPKVKLEQMPFVKYGDASGWLTSPLFGLRHARSKEAESAIEAAKQLQIQTEPNQRDVAEVSERLKRYLAGDDRFWPRWLYFAERHGVSI